MHGVSLRYILAKIVRALTPTRTMFMASITVAKNSMVGTVSVHPRHDPVQDYILTVLF